MRSFTCLAVSLCVVAMSWPGSASNNTVNTVNETAGLANQSDSCYFSDTLGSAKPPMENHYQYVGAIMAVFASTLANLGVTIQKTSHNKDDMLHASKKKPYYKRPLWICGLVTVISASLCDFEALSFATQVLVATVGGAVTILSNLTFAVILLKEKLTLKDLFGSLLVIGGVIMAAWANPPDHLYTVDDFLPKFIAVPFLIYTGLLVVMVATMMIAIKCYLSKNTKNDTKQHEAYLYAISAGVFGGWAVLLGKCTSEVVRETLMGGPHSNQFVHPATYFFMTGMLVSLITQTALLNEALMRGDTLSVFPFFQASWILFSSLSGLIFYQQVHCFGLKEWLMFPAALTLVLIGIYLLSQHDKARAERFSSATSFRKGNTFDRGVALSKNYEPAADAEDGAAAASAGATA